MRTTVRGAVGLLFGTALALVTARSAAQAAPPGDGDEDESGTQKDREPCALAGGVNGTLVTETERQQCGSGGCGQSEWLSIEGSNGEVWLSVQNELGDFAERAPFEVSCDGGSVHVRPEDGGALELRFVFDRASGELRLAPEISAAVKASWRRAAVTDTAEITHRQTVVQLLEAVLPTPASPADATLAFGIGRSFLDSVRLLVVRDELKAGAWEAAERDLGSVSAGAPRRKELVAALAAERSRTQPITLSSKRRLGTFSKAPATPLTPDEIPALFWRDDEVCVTQEDSTPPARMRCFSPAKRSWDSAVPLQVPDSGGQNLRGMGFPNVLRCDGFFVAQKRVPETGTPCADGFGVEVDALVGVVEHDAMLLAGSPPSFAGLTVNRGPDRDQPLTAAQAAALVRTSAGSLVLGDGCCFLAADGRVARLKGRPDQRWNVLGEPPPGEQWSGTTLVSPDQRWLVVGSSPTAGGRTTLWLSRVERR